jgi:hypothetical protein
MKINLRRQMASFLLSMAIPLTANAEAVLIRTVWDDPSVGRIEMLGTALLDADNATVIGGHMEFLEADYQVHLQSGHWNGYSLQFSGIGCTDTPHTRWCEIPTVDMSYADETFYIEGQSIFSGDVIYHISSQHPLGDSNRDGIFDSSDLVYVMIDGEYEDNIICADSICIFNAPGHRNSRWVSGDWTADREFDTSDLVAAFQEGKYEVDASVPEYSAIPEPSAVFLASLGVALTFRRRK